MWGNTISVYRTWFQRFQIEIETDILNHVRNFRRWVQCWAVHEPDVWAVVIFRKLEQKIQILLRSRCKAKKRGEQNTML